MFLNNNNKKNYFPTLKKIYKQIIKTNIKAKIGPVLMPSPTTFCVLYFNMSKILNFRCRKTYYLKTSRFSNIEDDGISSLPTQFSAVRSTFRWKETKHQKSDKSRYLLYKSRLKLDLQFTVAVGAAATL